MGSCHEEEKKRHSSNFDDLMAAIIENLSFQHTYAEPPADCLHAPVH